MLFMIMTTDRTFISIRIALLYRLNKVLRCKDVCKCDLRAGDSNQSLSRLAIKTGIQTTEERGLDGIEEKERDEKRHLYFAPISIFVYLLSSFSIHIHEVCSQ